MILRGVGKEVLQKKLNQCKPDLFDAEEYD